MCQIIALKIPTKNVVPFLKKYKGDIRADLHEKGGEGYSFFFLSNDMDEPIIQRGYNFKKVFYKFISKFESSKLKSNNYGVLVLFSRQTPEMENAKVNLPPYYNSQMDTYFFVHGTINNDKELEQKFQVSTTVDSEIVKYIPYSQGDSISTTVVEYLEGLYSIIGIQKGSLNIHTINNGMGIWKSILHNEFTNTAVYKMTPTKRKYFKQVIYVPPVISDLTEIDNIVVSYSGGMDVTLSAYKTIYNWIHSSKYNPLNNNKVTLVYFRYGTQAEEKEIESLNKFKKYLIKLSKISGKEFIVDTKVFRFVPFGKSKLQEKSAQGSIKETESTLAYVPYRNSLFAMNLAHYLQTQNLPLNKRRYIVFGLNLSEGQVYGDNNQAWLLNMNNVLQLGGKKFDRTISLYAPYINKTKKNMLKMFIEEFGLRRFKELIDISFSCYYPKNGNPCGKCGSCILREKALKTVLKG